MSTTQDQVFTPPEGKFLVDPYENWALAQGTPIHRAAWLDLLAIETAPWKTFGCDGAICHLDGRDDFLALFVYDLAPGAATAPIKHLHEEVFYALSGAGVAEIETPDGATTRVEWREKTLFAAPMNARIVIRNSSDARARIAGVNDLRYLISLYRNETFLFDNPRAFPSRANGDYSRDLAALPPGAMTRPNEHVAPLALASSNIGADVVEIAPGKYGRAAKQMFGALGLGVAGEGMMLSWTETPHDARKIFWRHGIAFAGAGLEFHQHFNLGATPAKYLSIDLGSLAEPMFRPRRKAYGDDSVYAAGSAVVEFAAQDATVEAIFAAARKR